MIISLLFCLVLCSFHGKSDEYRWVCYKFLAHPDKRLRIPFKSFLAFVPQHMEFHFKSIERTPDNKVTGQQDVTTQLSLTDEYCDDALEVGWVNRIEGAMREITITLRFGAQQHILDLFKFTLHWNVNTEPIYAIGGIYGKSMIDMRVLDVNKLFERKLYEGPFYDHKIRFLGSASVYCLQLWYLLPGKELSLHIRTGVTQILPEFITVDFRVKPESLLEDNDSLIRFYTDFGRLRLCSENEGKPETIQISIQPEITPGKMNFTLMDPNDQMLVQSVYDLKTLLPSSLLLKDSTIRPVNINLNVVPLNRVQYSDPQREILFYKEHIKQTACQVKGKRCILDNHYHGNIKLYTQSICEIPAGPRYNIDKTHKLSPYQYEQCLTNAVEI